MTLLGWTLPLSPSGRASLLPPPPWHYSGDIISADFTADPEAVAALMPAGIEATEDGRGSFVFADWCSSADLDPRIRADPAAGQYREAYVVLYGRRSDGSRVGRVPFIWVDSDLSLVRGLVQGFPKKLGQIAMTRPIEIGRGGWRREIGARFAAHVSSRGARLCTLAVSLTGVNERSFPPAVATPLLHTRHWPSLDKAEPAVHELVQASVVDFELGPVFTGDAELAFAHSEFEELDSLGPVSVGGGYVHSMAFSVTGGRVVDPGSSRGAG
ncbi:MAG: acetoacetate decarboxylase family protein [Actinomycetota bacterium]|nr:acetoacetate decarboxylase family protein [Actinomycetota bacterium]